MVIWWSINVYFDMQVPRHQFVCHASHNVSDNTTEIPRHLVAKAHIMYSLK